MNEGRSDKLPASMVVDPVETKELEVEGSDLTLPLVPDFAAVVGFLAFRVCAFISSDVAGRYLYSMKSGSLSQTKTSWFYLSAPL
jgi:hypothetical protein